MIDELHEGGRDLLYTMFGDPDVRRPVFKILRYSEALATTKRPARRGKARLWCCSCGRYHHLKWGEMQAAVKSGATSLHAIVDRYSWKYCRDRQNDGYSYG